MQSTPVEKTNKQKQKNSEMERCVVDLYANVTHGKKNYRWMFQGRYNVQSYQQQHQQVTSWTIKIKKKVDDLPLRCSLIFLEKRHCAR